MTEIAFELQHILQLITALPDAALVINDTGVVVAANEKAVEAIGSDPARQHLAFSFRAPAVLAAISDVFRDGTAARVQHRSGRPIIQVFDIHVALMGHLASGGRLALVTFHDNTYQEQIERMRSDFVANASHELRTPLTSLTGFIETMQGAAQADPEAQAKFLLMMKAQAERMARLIDDLLSLSRIEVTEHVAPTETIDLVLILRQVVSLLSSMAEQEECQCVLDVPESAMVTGDAQQLTQVIHNLVENAIKYAGSGKRVDISIKQLDEKVILAVKDHGAGIEPHHVPRLTERFYRVSAQDSRKRGGTGLGLAIAKHIMNRHRGKLVIESKIDEGSTFSIHLNSK